MRTAGLKRGNKGETVDSKQFAKIEWKSSCSQLRVLHWLRIILTIKELTDGLTYIFSLKCDGLTDFNSMFEEGDNCIVCQKATVKR